MAGYTVTIPTGETFHFNNAKDFEDYMRNNGLWDSDWDSDWDKESKEDDDDEIH
jgi:hypothetical protein